MQEACPFAQVRIRELEMNNFDYPVKNLFHPAVTLLRDGRWMASMQDISNSDFYGEPLYAVSADRGATWSRPAAVEALRHSHRPGTPEDFVEAAADYNGDTKINAKDVTALMRLIVANAATKA